MSDTSKVDGPKLDPLRIDWGRPGWRPGQSVVIATEEHVAEIFFADDTAVPTRLKERAPCSGS